MKPQELRDLEEDKLRERLATARRELFGLRMQHATGELENTAGLKTAKRDLARALTVAHQRGVEMNVSAKRDGEPGGRGSVASAEERANG